MLSLHPRCRLLCSLLGAGLFLNIACASLHPPVDSSEHFSSALSLDPLRADTDGLALTLYAPDASAGDKLQIWRSTDGKDWSAAESLDVNEPLAEALATGRVEWRDSLPETETSLQYRLHLHGDETQISDPLELQWRGIPHTPAPTATICEDSQSSVLLSWDENSTNEIHILRRNVLDEDHYTPFIVVDIAAGTTFEDDDVEPGGVYSYRLQFVDRRSSLPAYGDFSESIYISVPD